MELALDTTGRAFRRIVAQGAAITAESPPESLHDLRKRAKELRYLLEFFASLHDPVAYRKVVGELKSLQDGLGDFQDSQVQREEIHALADAMGLLLSSPAVGNCLARNGRETALHRFTREASARRVYSILSSVLESSVDVTREQVGVSLL